MDIRQLQLDGRTYRCAVAISWRDQRRGLAFTPRADWPGLDGLLLPFPFPCWWPIWTRHMHFPIDIIWLRNGRVVDAHYAVPPHPWRIHIPRAPADAVFERIIDA